MDVNQNLLLKFGFPCSSWTNIIWDWFIIHSRFINGRLSSYVPDFCYEIMQNCLIFDWGGSINSDLSKIGNNFISIRIHNLVLHYYYVVMYFSGRFSFKFKELITLQIPAFTLRCLPVTVTYKLVTYLQSKWLLAL